MPTSYNGWPVLTSPPLDNSPIPGTNVRFAPGVLAGDVADVLFFAGAWINIRVEPAVAPGCWGYSYRANRNANNWSCHASATAVDYNAPQHPNGVHGTWTAAEKALIHDLCNGHLEGVVQWGEDYDGVIDGMHLEIIKGAADVARVAAKLRRDYGPRDQWPDRIRAAAGGNVQPPPPPPPPSDGYSEQAKIDQRNLLDTGFDPGAVDGYWGEKSKAAARAFQYAARLPVDGVVGDQTRAMLKKVPSWRSAPSLDGDGGYPARDWQQQLKNHGWRITVDNAWGDHSASILRQYQLEKGLWADGIRDPESWTSLHCTVN